jgi:hypothetical protein
MGNHNPALAFHHSRSRPIVDAVHLVLHHYDAYGDDLLNFRIAHDCILGHDAWWASARTQCVTQTDISRSWYVDSGHRARWRDLEATDQTCCDAERRVKQGGMHLTRLPHIPD